MNERIQSFTRKVEAYLVAFTLTLGLLLMASLQSAQANVVELQLDNTTTNPHVLNLNETSYDSEECGDYDGDNQCDLEPGD